MNASRHAFAAGEQEGLNVSLDIFKSSLSLLSALERVAADALAATGGSASPRQAIVHVPVNAAYVAEVCRNAREKFTAARGHLVDMESRVLQHTGSLKQPVMPPASVASLMAPPMPGAHQLPLQPIPPRLVHNSSDSGSGVGHPPLQPPRKLSSSEVQESPLTNRLRGTDGSVHSFRQGGGSATPYDMHGGVSSHMMDTALAHAETRNSRGGHSTRATTPTHGSPPQSVETSPTHLAGGPQGGDGMRPGDAPPAEDDGSAYKGELPALDFATISGRIHELAAAVRLRIAPAPSQGPSRSASNADGDFSDDDGSQGGGPVSPSLLLGSPPPRQAPAASPWTGRPGSSRSDAFRADTPPHRRASVVPFYDNAGGLHEGLTPAAGVEQHGGFMSGDCGDSDGDEAARRAKRAAQLPPAVALAVPLGMLGVPPWAASLLRDAEIDAGEHSAELAKMGTGPGSLHFAPSAGGGGVPNTRRGGSAALETGMPLAQAFSGLDAETGDTLALFVGLDGTMGSSVCRSAIEYSAYMHMAWRAASGPVRELLLLLQAMRWRITRSAAGKSRDNALRAIVSADVLGCRAAQAALRRVTQEDIRSALEALARAGLERGGAGLKHGSRSGVSATVSAVAQCSLISALLGCGHPLVVDSAVRLVNSMASTPAARAYLLQDPSIVPCFTRVLLLHGGDTTTRQNAVGALQKMSTAQVPQDIMIRTGVMPWALRVLREHHAPVADTAGSPLGGVSLYSLQYTAAMVTTMAQRVAGRRSAAAAPAGVIETLIDYLGGPAAEVSMFAAAAVYSLLANKGLLGHARVIGLPEVLEALKGRVPEEHVPGLQFVLSRLEDAADEGSDDGAGGQDGKRGGHGQDDGEATDESDGEGYDSDGVNDLTAWLAVSAPGSTVASPTSQGTSTWEAEDGDEGDAVVATVLDTWGEALLKAAAAAVQLRHKTPLPLQDDKRQLVLQQPYTPSTLGNAAVGPGTPVPRSQVDFGAAAAGAIRRVRSRSILGNFEFMAGAAGEYFPSEEDGEGVQLQPAPVPARDALGLTVVQEMSATQETDSRRSSQAVGSIGHSQRNSLSSVGGGGKAIRPPLPGLIRHAPAISPGTRGGGRRGSAAAFSSLMDERSPALFKPRHVLARSPRTGANR